MVSLYFDISLQAWSGIGCGRMYRSKYNSQTELVSVSLGEDSASASQTEDEGCLYLSRVLGEELSHMLTECATVQPGDPILFLASELER